MLCVVMPNVVILKAVMLSALLNAIMLNAVTLGVMAQYFSMLAVPFKHFVPGF